LSPLIECKVKRKTGHSTQQATTYFTLLNAGAPAILLKGPFECPYAATA
jgi:hypothetical protein